SAVLRRSRSVAAPVPRSANCDWSASSVPPSRVLLRRWWPPTARWPGRSAECSCAAPPQKSETRSRSAADPRHVLPDCEQLLAAFGVPIKPQLLFPLNIDAHSAIAGHILFVIPPEGAGVGIGGDVPEKRRYLFEI